jgi:hypothetical protein
LWKKGEEEKGERGKKGRGKEEVPTMIACGVVTKFGAVEVDQRDGAVLEEWRNR